MSILIIGSLNTDLITVTPRMPAAGETLTATSFHTAPGGKGANQAVACARLSLPPTKVSMIGSVGRDSFASPLLSELEDSGVDVTRVTSHASEPTGSAVIVVDGSNGENRILIHTGANGTVTPECFPETEDWNAVVLQLEIPVPTVLSILSAAKAQGVKTIFNPAPAVPLPEECWKDVDWCIVNETEAAILTAVEQNVLDTKEGVETAGKELLRRGCGAVVVTLGARGAYWCAADEEGWVETGVKKEDVVDSTGAGDTFVGALAVGVVEGKRREECVDFARRAAGRAVRKRGAMAGVPWRREVEEGV
ncbi:Ribokinase-like protein [Pyronema omphalodes]|nr:Ribokinase-like protein [Pyronema omphalodes]